MCSVWRVQVATALSGRHCILKQGHDVIITFSRSIHINIDPTRSEYMRSAVNYARAGRWSLPLFPSLQFTHYRGRKPSSKTLIDKSERSELEVVIGLWSVVLETTSAVKWKSSQDFYVKKNRQMQFLVLALCVAAAEEREPQASG